jgi:hypothetical protein
VDGEADNLRVSWKQVKLDVREEALEWSEGAALHFGNSAKA